MQLLNTNIVEMAYTLVLHMNSVVVRILDVKLSYRNWESIE
jgi:hypothetical protein